MSNTPPDPELSEESPPTDSRRRAVQTALETFLRHVRRVVTRGSPATDATPTPVLVTDGGQDNAKVIGHNQGSGQTVGVWGEVDSSDGCGFATPDDVRIDGTVLTNGTDFIVEAGDQSTANAQNVVLGHASNTVAGGTEGVTIAGGGFDSGSDDASHVAFDDYGTIGGGYFNQVGTNDDTNQPSATVGGGFDNTASGGYATVGGGYQNTASDGWATVGGGEGNNANGRRATVAGGRVNTASSTEATVGGGRLNTASGGWATVGGGRSNTASGGDATAGGGIGNTASADYATVGGGDNNTASGSRATVGGGRENTAIGEDATVGGGRGNTADSYATVGGGIENTASSKDATVAGGVSNTASGYIATVGGGFDNTASGGYATVGGGRENTASGFQATVAGGGYNTASALGAMVPGGYSNEASGRRSFAAGRNARATKDDSFVWNGSNNTTDVESPAPSTFSVQADNGIWLGTDYTPSIGSNRLIDTSTGAYLSDGGTWTDNCSVTEKEQFTPTDSIDVLEKVDSLEVSTWQYRADDGDARHMGPTAEQFHETFGLGDDAHHIAPLDTGGVALTAIQGLSTQLEQKADRDELQDSLDAKDDRIEKIEADRDELQDNLDAKDDRIEEVEAENDELRERLADIEAHLGLDDPELSTDD